MPRHCIVCHDIGQPTTTSSQSGTQTLTIRIGVDTGGTFTDVVATDRATGAWVRRKVPSTRDDPSEAIAAGVSQVLSELHGDAVERLVHGTTVATNALLERRGARTALLTTAGVRDVLYIARQNRPALYDLRSRRPKPLVPRQWCFEVSERIGYDGNVRLPIDWADVDRVLTTLVDEQIEAVAIGFLFSHANPEHELAVAKRIADRMPKLSVTLSHQMASVPGEYERFSTAAVNSYVQPVMREYLHRLSMRLADDGIDADVLVMKSSGGVAPARVVADKSVETVLSGPAGGVMAVRALALTTPHKNLIAADMGGTSFDVAVVTHGKASHAGDLQIAGLPLRTPMLDLNTIGAGGGSIAWVDAGGALRVGPQSAGAVPGPACYGRGGSLPTVTDANLVLGRLVPDSRLAGGMQLDLEAARTAIDTVAEPLGISIEQAATGILRVVNTAMTSAIRKITVERGIDPRDYAICAYGGAGPLHAAELATELGIGRALIPRAPGVFSAEGLLGCDLREDRMQSHIEPLAAADLTAVRSWFRALETSAAETFDSVDYAASWSIGLRYLRQSNEIPISVDDGKLDADDLAARFADAHEQLYGFARRDYVVEIASLWVAVTVTTERSPPAKLPAATSQPVPSSKRAVYFDGKGVEATIHARDELFAGSRVLGPAIIEQDDSTTVIPPNWEATTDEWGSLLISEVGRGHGQLGDGDK